MRTAWPFCHAVCVNSVLSLPYIHVFHQNALIVDQENVRKAFTLTPPTASLSLSRRSSVAWGGRVGPWESLYSRGGVDVNVDRHFLLRRGHVLLDCGPEELSVSVGVWHVCQWKNFSALTNYMHHVWERLSENSNWMRLGFCGPNWCWEWHFSSLYFQTFGPQRSGFLNVMDCSHSTCSYVDLHCFFVLFF